MKRILFLVFFVCCFSFSSFAQQLSPDNKNSEQKIIRALRLIKNNYVDSADIDNLIEHAIKAMLEHLDPHSVYMDKEEIQKANEPLQGNFEGVGIQFQIIRDTVNVVGVIPGGPSELIGIQAGDKIVAINGEDAVGSIVTNTYVTSKLRGSKGTKVKLGIIRFPLKTITEYDIIRDKIPINSLDASYMIDNTIGYIKLNRFAATTMDEFLAAMEQLKKENMQSLILDLRGNSGGYLKTAIELTDQFFEKDKLLVYTEGLNAPIDKTYSTSNGEFKSGRLLVLVDQGSASASEILAGAIQDLDRGIIVGRRTFGKGLVQRPFNLTDGSVIRLTVSRYYTPSGRCIQKPYEDDTKSYRKEIEERLDKGEFFNQDSISFPDSLMYKTLNGRSVYGGGGIMPDVFVSLDTNRLGDFYVEVMRKNIISIFVSDYLQDNIKELNKRYSSVDEYKKDIKKNADLLFDDFIKYAKDMGAEIVEIEENTKEYLIYIINAHIARRLFENQAFYQIIREVDHDVIKAIEVIKNKKEFSNRGIKS